MPFELSSDLNNDGKIGGADTTLKTDGAKSDATDEEKEKATEYLFANDELSNGLWDKDDEDAPEGTTDDDDVQEIRTVCAATWGAIWFEHPIINKLSFYKTKTCEAAEKITFPLTLTAEATGKLPEKLYVRAEDVTVQIEGDLVMKFGKADKTETWAEDKLKLTIVKELGETKYFQASRDYILESNTRLFVREKGYPSDNPVAVFRVCGMLEEKARLRTFETNHVSEPLDEGIEAVGWANQDLSILLNGNQVTFSDGTTAEGALLHTTLTGEHLMTDKCHGRILETGEASFSEASSDNYNTTTTPMAGSPLAGPDPLPGTSDPGGKYLSQTGSSSWGWTFAAGQVPGTGFSAALGGLSTRYDDPNRNSFRNQLVGYAPMTGDGKGCVFSATQTTGEGHIVELKEDASASGVPALPGSSRSSDICLLILDSGDTSVGLMQVDPDDTLRLIYKGLKHSGIPYYVNTYIGFYTAPPRPSDDFPWE